MKINSKKSDKTSNKAKKVLNSIVKSNSMTANEIMSWFKDLECKLNGAFEDYGLQQRISFEAIYENKDRVELRREDFSKAIKKEGMYIETCDSVSRVLKNMQAGQHIALLGLIQSSKSATQTSAAILYSVFHFLQNGQIVLPIFILPNGDSFIGQFSAKLSLVSIIFDDAIIYLGKKKVKVGDYFAYQVRSPRNTIAKEYFDRPGETIPNRKKVLRILDEVVSREHCIIPVSRKYQEVIRILVNAANQAGWLTLLARDESHHAVSKHGVNDDMYGGQYEDEGYELISENEQAIYSMIRDKNVRVMAASANNWPAMIAEFAPVPIAVNEFYCGLDFRYWLNKDDEVGKLVARDSGIKIKLPEIVSLSEFAAKIGCDDLKYVTGRLYCSELNFIRHKDKDENGDFPFNTHGEYKDRCNKAITAMCKWVFKNNPKDSVKSPKRGILIRLCNSNDPSAEFLEHLKKALPKVKVVKYFDDDTFTTIPELLRRYDVGSDDHYIIIATARARMSDTFPINCAYGFDFTYRTDTLSACLQGILGRMSGYFKEPLVVLSDINASRIREYIDSDYRVWRGKLLGTAARRASRAYVGFDRKNFAKTDKMMNEIFEQVEKKIVQKGKKINWSDAEKCKIVMGERTPECIFYILTDEQIKHLNTLALRETQRRLILKHEVDDKGGSYKKTDKNYVAGTVRMQNANRDKNRGGRKSSSDEIDISVQYRVMFRIGRKYNKPILTGFDLALYQRHLTCGDIENSSYFSRIGNNEKI